jgi:uncharacterized membrane protein
MADDEGSVLHQQALTVMGFFTGLTLTALVLILNSRGSFRIAVGPVNGDDYFQIVTTYVAMVGSISSVGIVAFLEVAGGLSPKYSYVDKIGTTCFFVSVFGFMGVLPLLLSPFTEWGAALVLSLEIFLLVTYFLARRAPVPPRALDR